MAPSAASTVTSAPRPARREKTIRVVGGGQGGDGPAPDELPRDPLELKYRDFFWTYTEEPHRTRRLEIIKAHPEVTKLCGPEPLTKYVVLLVVSIQVACAYLVRDTPFLSLPFWLLAYVVGATANQNLFLAIHEISHNLAFRSPTANRLLAIFANLPIGIPYSASFRPYHLTHHKSLGVDGLDTDLPTALEAVFLDSILGKAFFCTFQILFYALRPMAVYRVPFTWVSALNVAVQLAFDAAVLALLGRQSLLYLVLSSFLAGSLHPLAGHFIAEHYVYATVTPAQADPANGIPVPETYSYYGPLNFLTYNVGLHNEHHDFPAVPWTRLHRLHDVAREFYADLPHHTSWTYVLWRFIFDESVGIRCRVKRSEGGRLVGQGLQKQKSAAETWKDDELES
ncbi:fatty acid desaturase-domain-containing protein [Xylaria palmicola]|nr:fatty acid desaturase-domain-containing protein [Xylaria palmicola]